MNRLDSEAAKQRERSRVVDEVGHFETIMRNVAEFGFTLTYAPAKHGVAPLVRLVARTGPNTVEENWGTSVRDVVGKLFDGTR